MPEDLLTIVPTLKSIDDCKTLQLFYSKIDSIKVTVVFIVVC